MRANASVPNSLSWIICLFEFAYFVNICTEAFALLKLTFVFRVIYVDDWRPLGRPWKELGDCSQDRLDPTISQGRTYVDWTGF